MVAGAHLELYVSAGRDSSRDCCNLRLLTPWQSVRQRRCRQKNHALPHGHASGISWTLCTTACPGNSLPHLNCTGSPSRCFCSSSNSCTAGSLSASEKPMLGLLMNSLTLRGALPSVSVPLTTKELSFTAAGNGATCRAACARFAQCSSPWLAQLKPSRSSPAHPC